MPLSKITPHPTMPDKFYQTLIAEQLIQKRVKELADEIIANYQGKDLPVLIPIANGASICASDLIRYCMDKGTNLAMEFIKVITYGKGLESSGQPKKRFEINNKLINGRDVLIIDDVLDTGITITYVTAQLLKMGAKSVNSVVLLVKPEEVRQASYTPKFIGFEIPNKWVEGYGLDSRYFGRGRRDIIAVLDDPDAVKTE